MKSEKLEPGIKDNSNTGEQHIRGVDSTRVGTI